MNDPTPKAIAATPVLAGNALWKDYLSLTKPEISFLVAISALGGFFLGSPDGISLLVLLWAVLGVVLTSAGGCALNHWMEKDLDGSMRRTADRPLPAGRIEPVHAARFGMLLVAAGLGVLCPLTNPLTGILAAAAVVLYLFVYTPLKRISTLNTFVGTIPGALPALGGYTAATGDFGVAGLCFFGVLVFWQLPHFHALAWMYRADYARGGYAMLAVKKPDGRVLAIQTVVFSVLMVAASLIPALLGSTGLIYAFGAAALAVWFGFPVVRFIRSMSNTDARGLLKATILYIPVLVALIVADRLLLN